MGVSFFVAGGGKAKCYGPDWAIQLFGFLEETSLADFMKRALTGFPEDIDVADPWQFRNVLVR